MGEYRVETVLGEDGSLALHDLPFTPGQRLEVIVLSAEIKPGSDPYPLRKLPYRYDDPFAPAVDPQEWDAMK